MNYAEAQRSPGRNTVGLSVVVGLHVILAWALVNGLARKIVDVVKGPIETKIIEEVKPPPPPPPDKLPPPPPKSLPPPPSFVPPPEVNVTTPTNAPTITTTNVAPPPADFKPQVSASPAPVPPAPPAPPARTAPKISFTEADKPDYTAAARRAEIECEVVVAYTMETNGTISEANIEKSCGSSREHKQLDRAAVEAVKAVRGKPGTVDGKPERLSGRVAYNFKLD